MEKRDITPIIEKIKERTDAHRLAPGSYARYLWQDGRGRREMGENPYGCADAANILYTIQAFPREQTERDAFVRILRSMQDADGLFHEHTHHTMHTTAHCIAALELFDAAPEKPCTALFPYLEKEKLYALLDGLRWNTDPWRDSHEGAGIYVAMNLTGKADREWNRLYFDWMWENADPETGFWAGKDASAKKEAPLYHYMAGGFHYMFNHEYAGMPYRYPDKMIDTCIRLLDEPGLMPPYFGKAANFIEIDWIFAMTRAMRQTPHRFCEAVEHLERFAEGYLDYWEHADWEKDETINDMHCLFGGVCGLAELQHTLRGKLISDKPLRLVLDRRPFI